MYFWYCQIRGEAFRRECGVCFLGWEFVFQKDKSLKRHEGAAVMLILAGVGWRCDLWVYWKYCVQIWCFALLRATLQAAEGSGKSCKKPTAQWENNSRSAPSNKPRLLVLTLHLRHTCGCSPDLLFGCALQHALSAAGRCTFKVLTCREEYQHPNHWHCLCRRKTSDTQGPFH